MAGGQSIGTFIRIPGETDELRDRASADVVFQVQADYGRDLVAGSGTKSSARKVTFCRPKRRI